MPEIIKTNANCIWTFKQGPYTNIAAYLQKSGQIVVTITDHWIFQDKLMSKDEFKLYRYKKDGTV